MTEEDRLIKRDRMRYVKNSLASNLAIVGILFDVFYFVSLYRSDVGTYYYNILIGASIIYNLIFMLAVFLASEGVKNYQVNYSYLLLLMGILQFVRIFIIPYRAHKATTLVNGVEVAVMKNSQFMWVVAFLVISGACLLASAIINFIRCRELSEHLKSIGQQQSA